MQFNVYYQNHRGQILDLVEVPYRLQTADLFDYAWEPYTQSGYITGFKKEIMKKTAVLTISADTREEYYTAVNRFYETVELDLLDMIPGRLFIGTQYMTCYIIASTKTEWEYGIEQMDVELTVTTDYPYWVREHPYGFSASDATSTNNKRYGYRYAYRYANGLTNLEIKNEHFHDANFLLRISGPCVNPLVVIDGHPYQTYVVLEPKEYLEISSREGTIIKTMMAGQKVNCFHSRSKSDDVFRKVPPGWSSVNWSGKFDFEIILYEERGEPKWP